ncbi:MAG: ion transporter [Firmicutes bacterium]|nr:ion transporter [Bacillota bacterium]MCM1401900.1 ion transporter [Bacteroides sp.]MCM1477786.1 ion transporter [Bacteroides sp.]
MKPFLKTHKKAVYNVLNALILSLSAALLIYLSILGLKGIEFFSNRGYMTFQLWVCYVFIADFFIELYMADNRSGYLKRRWLFLLLSVPYLNIVAAFHIPLTYGALYFLRFIPLARGALAMSIVVGYLSRNRLTNIFASYTVVLMAFIYMGSLIFYEVEHGHNPDVTSFWTALWWAFSVATTAGCDIYPVTAPGKIVCAVLPTMGTFMFPLFTVVVTNAVRARLTRETAAQHQQSHKGSDHTTQNVKLT